MMILKCCSQYVSKLGKLSSGHRQHWKRAAFILIPKKDNTKESSNYHTNLLISHASKVILQARLEAVHEPRSSKLDLEKAKKKQTRDQIANIHWITVKAREFRKNFFIYLLKPLTVWITTNYGKFLQRWV